MCARGRGTFEAEVDMNSLYLVTILLPILVGGVAIRLVAWSTERYRRQRQNQRVAYEHSGTTLPI